MEINEIIDAIEARVELNRPNVQAQAVLISIDTDLILTFGCVVDPTKITYELMSDVSDFNDEANPEAYIQFREGKLINNGSDNSLFMLMFVVSKCNGGL